MLAVLADLRDVGCDILTLGQYLQPTRQHLPIARYLDARRSSTSSAPRRARSASATSSPGRWCAARTTPGSTYPAEGPRIGHADVVVAMF